MNERLVIRLVQDGRQLPITSLGNEGVIIGTEVDTWPTDLVLEFDADNAVTKFRMDRMRQINGWESFQYKLNLHVEGGDLVVTGVRANALPFGSYWVRLRIGEYIIPAKKYRCKVEENGETRQEVEVDKDPRRVELTGEFSTFDPEIVRVLSNAESRIDGSTIPTWLTSTAPRDRRKACLLNLMAKLRSAPVASSPLIKNVRFLFFCDVERAYAAVDAEYYQRLLALAKDPSKPFYAEGEPTSPIHRRLLERIRKFESAAERFQLRSFRQEGKNSFQSVVAIPPNEVGFTTYYADLDIDLGNPLQDLEGVVIHIGELLSGTTDHLSLYKKLAEDSKVKPYLYYKVVT